MNNAVIIYVVGLALLIGGFSANAEEQEVPAQQADAQVSGDLFVAVNLDESDERVTRPGPGPVGPRSKVRRVWRGVDSEQALVTYREEVDEERSPGRRNVGPRSRRH